MDLQIWDTPFAREKCASIWLIPETHGDSTATVVVAPGGVDAYPKYLVRFSAVYGYLCEEEAGGLGFQGGWTPGSPVRVGCAFVWRDSPQAAGYAPFIPDMPFHGGTGPVVHYVLLGGDNNVGVISAEAPGIERVDHPRQLTVTHEV
jgi:hypothetical protein